MSLQHTAHHLAAQGRNGDSMLMHVTPHEVAGLQALAQQRGGSLTANPTTGLPEANFLDDIGLGGINKFVPTIAGAGLSFFTGVDPMTAAGMVGGLSGITSGSLKEGIMAGLGAYGGASLTEGLGNMGSDVNTRAANAAFDSNNPAMDAERTAAIKAAAHPDVGAGFGAAMEHPMDFLKNNKFAIGAAALPALVDMATPGAGPTALKNTGYIRRYEKNPVTGALEQAEAVPVDQWGDRPAVSFGGVGQPVKHMAGGGLAGTHLVYNPTTKAYDTVDASGKPVGPVTFGGTATSTNTIDANDTRSDSQKAYDYLMGKTGAQNPMLFYHQQNEGPITPADLSTRTGGHYALNEAGTGYDWVPDTATTTPAAGLAALAGGQQMGTQSGTRSGDMPPMLDATKQFLDNEEKTPGARDARMQKVQDYIGMLMPGGVAVNALQNMGLIGLGKVANALTPARTDTAPVEDKQGEIVGPQLSDIRNIDNNTLAGGPMGYTTGPQYSDASTVDNRPEAGGPMSYGKSADGSEHDAKGGFFHNGKFNYHPDQMYAQGGIAALAGGGLGSLAGYADGGYTPPAPIENLGSLHPKDLQAKYDLATQHANVPLKNKLKNEMDLRSRLQNPQIYAGGGGVHPANLGSYSDGGQLLKGPGDGVSDSIPATIGQGQPARLADGEFVIPARIVSELGNGSTEAGAKQLYAMMARIQAGRAKTTGKNKVATDSKADRHLPA